MVTTNRPIKDPMNDEEFSHLQDLVSKELGLVLKGAKRSLLQLRVSQRIGALNLGSYRDYFDFIVSDPSKNELYILASHITNKETYFFRERQQFDIFGLVLAHIKAEKQKQGKNALRFLSLASSTGEEAYSMNIVIQESGLFLHDWDIKIIGVDIDNDAIMKAREAVYGSNSFRTTGSGAGPIQRYFTREQDRYLIKKYLKKNVEFRHGNLISRRTYADLTGMDVIFCRNVMIYMSDETIRKVAENLHEVLSDTGYLFVGASESLIRKTDLFRQEYIQGAIVYRKNKIVQ